MKIRIVHSRRNARQGHAAAATASAVADESTRKARGRRFRQMMQLLLLFPPTPPPLPPSPSLPPPWPISQSPQPPPTSPPPPPRMRREQTATRKQRPDRCRIAATRRWPGPQATARSHTSIHRARIRLLSRADICVRVTAARLAGACAGGIAGACAGLDTASSTARLSIDHSESVCPLSGPEKDPAACRSPPRVDFQDASAACRW